MNNKEEWDYDLEKLNRELRRTLGSTEPEDEEEVELPGDDERIEISKIDISETEFEDFEENGDITSTEDQSKEKNSNVEKRKASTKKTSKTGKLSKGARRKRIALTISLSVLDILLLLVVGVIVAFTVMNKKGESRIKQNKTEAEITALEDAQVAQEGKFIVYNGEKYCYNDNVINILCMGVDKSIQETSDENIGENGQADVIILAALDSETGKLSLINISREAMVDVNLYNVEGKFLGTENMQLCLAYAYGDGKEKSCMNTAESVSRLMYGMPVNAYAALDLDGISVLNDSIGGVSLEVIEDLTNNDPALQAGKTVTLTGEQAHTYVRSRNTEVLDSNSLRMERQKQYLSVFLQKAISEIKTDLSVSLDLYQTASDFMITDIGSSEVAYLASLLIKNGITGGEMLTVPGEVRDGGEYAEFIPDDEKLYEMILDVFYDKVNEN